MEDQEKHGKAHQKRKEPGKFTVRLHDRLMWIYSDIFGFNVTFNTLYRLYITMGSLSILPIFIVLGQGCQY